MPASPLPKKWSITGAGNQLFGTRDTPWGKAVEAFTRNAITHRRRLLSAAAACALIAAVAKSFNPAPYLSTAQLLIDPRGFRVFSTDLSGGVFDANAAINFVESQMVVLRSDRVLLNVVRSENQAAAKAANAPSAAAAKSADATETKALTALRRAVTVQRGERSFIVNVSASHEAPDGSARLANSVVEAFIREETSGRSERAVRLRGDFSSREDGLRKNLQQAEINVEAFRLSKGLVGLHDRTLLEQQLTQSITALGAAEAMEARSQARMMQLEVDPGTLGTGGRLEADMASRDIVVKLEGLTKARAELQASRRPTRGRR